MAAFAAEVLGQMGGAAPTAAPTPVGQAMRKSLALRSAAPILASEELLDEVGVTMAVEEEDEVERFREFLDSVSAEDFEE